MTNSPSDCAVVVPCFNDWACLDRLLIEIEQHAKSGAISRIVIVNDASTDPMPTKILLPESTNLKIEMITLRTNMGHQFAIASGIYHLISNSWDGSIIIMDSDGEDNPASIATLKSALIKNPSVISVAGRGRRYNSFTFKMFYKFYRIAFRFLTGKMINFGNFMVIPNSQARRLILRDDTWNHLAGSVLKNCDEVVVMKIDRRERFYGESKMNFISLVGHGLGALAVFAELIFIRMIVASMVLLMLCLTMMITVLYLKFFTNSSFPGWTTSVLGFSSLLAALTFAILSITTISLILSKRKLQPLNFVYAKQFIVD